MTVRELMTDDLVTVTPDYTLREAAEAMADAHVSGLPVVEDGMAVGVISATDIMSFAAGSGEAGPRRRGALAGRSGAGRGAEIPSGYYMEDWIDRPRGPEDLLPESDRPEWNAAEEHTVEEFMTRALISLSPEATVQEAAAAMLQAGIRRLLVVDVDRLVGLISSTDVLQAVAEGGVGS